MIRLLFFAGVWLLLAGWNADYLAYGVVSVVAATALSHVLVPRSNLRLHPVGTARLVAWFLQQTGIGGVDVARRAIAARPDIAPEVVETQVWLPAGPARQSAMLLMNLMPGSMVQRETGADRVELHTLSPTLEPARQFDELQRRVAAAFSLPDQATGDAER
ncbi:MAG: Na+/H+ antiporter subunit E [Corynebacterium sp.]|uniref:Na+/H+ antiporter subunit E n=1 Tax=Corynebacterium sp. TaxID=1720 RepID=UPI0026E0A370|nr:Na+/H+ antiporter subunit E [Corynebacterium sp.]MDO5669259.1 Na+/H+ antiporter subunit E [Corynebacterium sp.]